MNFSSPVSISDLDTAFAIYGENAQGQQVLLNGIIGGFYDQGGNFYAAGQGLGASNVTQIQIIFQPYAGYTFTAAGQDDLGNTVGLVNGNYFLSVTSSGVIDSFGKAVDAAGTGVAGSNYMWEFYRLFGDVNGDRTVNSVDSTAFKAANGSSQGAANYEWYLDYLVEGNIDVGNSDSKNAFLSDYLETLNS